MNQDLHRRIRNAVRSNFEASPNDYESFEERNGFFADLNAALLERMDLPPDARVLDIGCGTGASCREILTRLPRSRVWGLDFSPAMLARARQALDAFSGRLHLVEGDAGRLSDAVEGPFDGILYSASIFLIPDFTSSLEQAARLLRAGGRVGLTFMDGVYDRRGANAIAEAETELGTGVSLKKPVRLDRLGEAFERVFAGARTERVDFPASPSFLEDFFSVPAMSAGLFPDRPYPRRIEDLRRIWDHLAGSELVFRWVLMTGRKRDDGRTSNIVHRTSNIE